MAQIFDRSSNALARASLVLTGLIVIALGVTLDQLQRSPWVTRQGQRPDQPVPFSHKHHVKGLGLQCQYCHTSVEKSSYAGIPPTKTCINCHAQIWTNAAAAGAGAQSWATGESIQWIRVHDLPDYVYFNHEIHVNKGIGCSRCHGRVDEMPLMYQQNTLQMEWCLNCHRNPAKNLRPDQRDLQHGVGGPLQAEAGVVRHDGPDKDGVPTAQTVSCTTADPEQGGAAAGLAAHAAATVSRIALRTTRRSPMAPGDDRLSRTTLSYPKFTNQEALGKYLTAAVPHPHAAGVDQLRDMPPMSDEAGNDME